MSNFGVGSVLLLLAFAAFIEGSHFRYGTSSWSRSGGTTTITCNLAMRRSYFGAPNQGTDLGAVGSVYIGNSYYSPSFIVTNADVANDLIYATTSLTVNNVADGTLYYFSSSARISNLNNNANGYFQFGGTIYSSLDSTSPVSGLLPVVTIPYNVVPYSFQITASDPDNNALSYRMAASNENQGTQPPGVSVSSSGLVTLSQGLAQGYWSTQQVITDSHGNSVAVDYLFNVVLPTTRCNGNCGSANMICHTNADCSCGSCVAATPALVTDAIGSGAAYTSSPVTPANGATVNVYPGQSNVISFVAYDQVFTFGSTIVESFAQLPSYVTASAQVPCDAAHGCTFVGNYTGPQLIQLTATPTAGSASATVCLGVVSNGDALPYSQHCVTLNVVSAVCGNGIVEAGEACDGGACCTPTCQLMSAATTCRGAVSVCDIPEKCDGSTATCPADVVVAANANVTCRPSAGVCDVAETCNGQSNQCPTDSFQAATVSCRASTGVCDPAEFCSDTAAACPADVLSPSTTVCRPVNGTCDVAEYCTGTNASCPIDRVANTAQCQTAAYICPRVANSSSSSTGYFCNSFNNHASIMCYTQIANGQTYNTFVNTPCPPGSGCACGYGVECSCNGRSAPCTTNGAPQVC